MDQALAAIRASGSQLQRFVLDNGLICLVKEDHSAPVVAVQIWVGTGSIDEQEYLGAGLSHYLEHMIFKGTAKRKPGDITREINDAGGTINAYTSFDRTVFHTDMPSARWRVGLDVLSDAVMNASFPEDEWAREKDVILREFAMGRDDPQQVADRMLWETAFVAHPYRIPVIGFEDVFRTMTRQDLMVFFRRHYVPDNMMVVILGDIDSAEVAKAIRTTFAGFARRARAPVMHPAEPPQLAPRQARETGTYNLTRMNWAYHTVGLSHADAAALDVLATVTGNGQSSRLVQEIKEKAQLVHSISAWSYTPRAPGLFGFSATLDPKHERDVLPAIEAEVARWQRDGFSRDEVDKARRMVLTSSLSALQTMHGQANDFASGEFYAADPRFSETYIRRLDSITPDTLRDVARRYLAAENRTITILAPEGTGESTNRPAASSAPTMHRLAVAPAGIPLLVREDHRLPFVCFSVVMNGGLLSESEANNGITHLMSEMMVRGTGSRSALEIARTAESLGGSIGAFSGNNSFGLQARCMTPNADTFMELLADCLLHPSFPADEVEKEKVVQIAAIAEQYDRPFTIAQEALRESLFPGHPYRWSPLGTTNTVSAQSRTGLLEHYRRHVVAGNMVLAIFGDITPDAARALAERHLGRTPRDLPPAREFRASDPRLPARSVRRLPRQQAIILSGFRGVDLRDPRRDALEVLKTAMSGLSSELGDQVREKRGLAYYVGAYQRTDIEAGHFVIYAGTREDAVAGVEQIMSNEVARITREGLTDAELSRARNELIAAHDMSLQDNMELAMNCALNELYGLGYERVFDTPKRVAAVTGAAVREAAAAVLQTGRQAVSIVLPAAEPKAGGTR